MKKNSINIHFHGTKFRKIKYIYCYENINSYSYVSTISVKFTYLNSTSNQLQLYVNKNRLSTNSPKSF